MRIIKNIVSPFDTNCYTVACDETEKAVVIDPGDSVESVIEAAEQRGFEIIKIINTHGHIDHAAGVAEMKKILNIPFYLHRDDEEFLSKMKDHGIIFGMKVDEIPSVDEYLKDGDVIEIGNLKLKVIHTPGHSRGGCCFSAEDKIFVGDTLFAGSIGRTDLPGGSFETLIHSIKTKLLVLDDNISVYCGHGPETTIGTERDSNPFLNSEYSY